MNVLKNIPYVFLHAVFWVLAWLFYSYFFDYAFQDRDFALLFATALLPVTIAATYTFAYYLIPQYLVSKRYGLFGLYSIYTIICTLFVVLIITFSNLVFLSDFQLEKMPLLSRNVVFVMIMIYLVVGVVSFVKLLHHHLETTNRNQELENKLLQGQLHLKQRELHYLKQQIHPHFLFNTLNTVYGFALKESKQTPDLILKLSNLLDYILNQIDQPSVPLSQEIKHLEAYIGLEEVRFRDMIEIAFAKAVTQEIDIPPMLFTSLVENAFKHGTPVDGKLKIDIDLKADEHTLQFQIKNTFDPTSQKQSHGIGLSNTRKRLETLYPENHLLHIEQGTECFTVTLTINFKSNE